MDKRNVYKVFLASPSDLDSERKSAREIVDRLNKNIQRSTNWHIDLLGWEDTLPKHCRPQEAINEDVKVCDLFVGLLWKRWGQPTRVYSSGFEEEYELAKSRLEAKEKIEIAIYFRDVDPKLLRKADKQLKKVLSFKENAKKQNLFLFGAFKNSKHWETVFHDFLLQKILESSKAQQESPESPEKQRIEQKQPESAESKKDGKKSKEISRLFEKLRPSAKAFFDSVDRDKDLQGLDKKIKGRVFLAAAASFSGELNETLTNHEIHALYTTRRCIDPLPAERNHILRTIVSDDVDLKTGWFWLRKAPADFVAYLLPHITKYSSAVSKINALELIDVVFGKRSMDFVKTQLQDEHAAVRLKAFRILSKYLEGPALKELIDKMIGDKEEQNRKEIATARLKLFALKKIDALNEVMLQKNELLWLDEKEKNEIIKSVNDETVKKIAGDEKNNFHDEAVAEAFKRNIFDVSNPAAFKFSSRATKVNFFRRIIEQSKPVTISLEDIRNAFADNKGGGSFGFKSILSLGFNKDEELIKLYLERAELDAVKNYVTWSDTNNDLAYEIYYMRSGVPLAHIVRQDLKDKFKRIWHESLERHVVMILKSVSEKTDKKMSATELELLKDIAKKEYEKSWKDLEDYEVKKLTTAALKVLLAFPGKEDIKFYREYLNHTDSDIQSSAVEGICKFGDESDVEGLLILAKKTSLKLKIKAAECALKLSKSKQKIVDAFLQSNDYELTKIALRQLKPYKLHLDKIKPLFNSDNEKIRFEAVAFLIKKLQNKKKQLEKFLSNYINAASYFYNVVCWLDRFLYAPGKIKRYYEARLKAT